MSGKVFSGNLRITPVNKNGTAIAAAIGVVNSVKCEIVIGNPTNIDQISRQNGTVNQIISRAQLPATPSLNISIDDTSDQRILAYALNGVTASYSQAAVTIAVQAGGTITDEAVTSTALGTPIQLANKQVSAVVVKNTAGSTTYVAGTDYDVNAAAGTVTPKVGGAITGTQSLKISYTAAAIAGEACTAPATLGDAFPLANRHISDFVLKSTSGSPTTYVAGTDYFLDPKSGFVTVPPGSNIAPGSSLVATYTAAAISGTTVRGGMKTSTLLRVDVQSDNLVDMEEGYFVCPIFQASASGNQDLFGKQMLVAALTGAMFLPPVGSAAYLETGGASFTLTAIDAA